MAAKEHRDRKGFSFVLYVFFRGSITGLFGFQLWLKCGFLKIDLNRRKATIYVHLITAGKDPRMRKEVS